MKSSVFLALCGVLALPLLGGCRMLAQKAAEAVMQEMGGTVNATDRADRAPATVDRAYIQSLKPLSSGAGLLVCEPIAGTAMASQSAWGAGAARWLQVQVAGQPELGTTPLWGVPENARIRLKLPDLKLNGKRADALAQSCGASHVAVATLGGTPANATLTYQLREVKSGKIVATAKISGEPKSLNAQLPRLARQMANALKIKANLPTQIALSPDDLIFLGTPKLQKCYRTDVMGPAAQTRLKTMAIKDPMAAILAQNWCKFDSEKSEQNAVNAMLKMAPNNALVWSQAAREPIQIVAKSAQLAELQRKFPNNALLLDAQRSLEQGNQARSLQVRWAEKAVRAAPKSSLAWNELCEANSDSAHQLRRGRAARDISSADWVKLNRFYARSQAAAIKATQVEPRDTTAWAKLAQAATFNNDPKGAEAALEKSLALEPRNDFAWVWGMEMMQPKWSGDAVKFVNFAIRAASHAADFDFPAEDVSYVFTEANARGDFKTVLEIVVAKDPRNYQALTELGAIYHYEDRSYPKAEQLYRQALKVNPRYDRAMSTLGDLTYWVHNDPKGAEALYLSAIAINPKDGYYHANLGRMYALTGQNARGVAEAELAKKWGFSDRSHPVWSATGVSPPSRW